MLSLRKAVEETLQRADARAEAREGRHMTVEAWENDKNAFRKHFDIGYDDFCQLIEALSPSQVEKYEKIRRTHQEAAILWAIHEGKSHGILRETGGERREAGVEGEDDTRRCDCGALNDAQAERCRKCKAWFD